MIGDGTEATIQMLFELPWNTFYALCLNYRKYVKTYGIVDIACHAIGEVWS